MSIDPFEPTVTHYSIDPFAHGIDEGLWHLTIERRAADQWAVCRWSRCLGTDGEWDYEPLPSSRTDEWKASHRFPLDEALRLARLHAPSVVVNGRTAAERLAELTKETEQ